MKIDWKHLSSTKGYRSIKSCMIRDIKTKRVSKERAYKTFNRVIGIAKSMSSPCKGIPELNAYNMSLLLNSWEEKRTYSWISFYSTYNFKKYKEESFKLPGLRSIKKYYRNYEERYNKNFINGSICNYLIEIRKSRGKKPRWTKIKRLERNL